MGKQSGVRPVTPGRLSMNLTEPRCPSMSASRLTPVEALRP